ncbi:hypothetical protein EJ02DRAFT_457508 [Clathrospora elynae]|uniref:Ig-like domain-containing protein n=1 Tax=Clathrospora elynae TaxID=706981 RepID=A0A6A5SGP3_9PLEO|nr:hypothetical protein EJ02DRAFT_457508 [Clathrospora elynae]
MLTLYLIATLLTLAAGAPWGNGRGPETCTTTVNAPGGVYKCSAIHLQAVHIPGDSCTWIAPQSAPNATPGRTHTFDLYQSAQMLEANASCTRRKGAGERL